MRIKDKSINFYRCYAEFLEPLETHEYVQASKELFSYAFDGMKTGKYELPSYIYKIIDQDRNKSGRNSKQYKEWRLDVFIRDGFTCAICGQVGGKLNAHHIKHYSKYPLLRYDRNNGITLCERCHREVHKNERKK